MKANHLLCTATFTVLIGVLPVLQAFAADPIQWPASEGGNDHYYEGVIQPGVTWNQAKAAAESKGGYLVTILSAAENDFLFANFVSQPQYWVFGFDPPYEGEAAGPWIGAYKKPSEDPSQGWQWVNNDEPLTYANWLPGEPNNYLGAGEYAALFFDDTPSDPPSITNQWNDWNPSNKTTSYIIEYDHRPLSLVTVIPGINDHGDALISFARLVLGCSGSEDCAVINICEKIYNRTICDNKPGPARQDELKRIIEEKIASLSENSHAKGLIVNVDMDLENYAVPEVFLTKRWQRSTTWAGNVANAVAEELDMAAPPNFQFQVAKRILIAHSAGADATRKSLESATSMLYNDLNIFNGRTEATAFVVNTVLLGYPWNHVKVFTTKGDIPGIPFFSLADSHEARFWAEQGDLVHLHINQNDCPKGFFECAHNWAPTHPESSVTLKTTLGNHGTQTRCATLLDAVRTDLASLVGLQDGEACPSN